MKTKLFVLFTAFVLSLTAATQSHGETMPEVVWEQRGEVELKGENTTKTGMLYEAQINKTKLYKVKYQGKYYIVSPIADAKPDDIFGCYTVIGQTRRLVSCHYPAEKSSKVNSRTSKSQWYDLGSLTIPGISDATICAFPVGDRLFYKLKYFYGYKAHYYYISPNVGTAASREKYNSTCSMLGKNLNLPTLYDAADNSGFPAKRNDFCIELGEVKLKNGSKTLEGELKAVPLAANQMGYFLKLESYGINPPAKKVAGTSQFKSVITYNDEKYYLFIYR